jgi:hypothetical protein
MWQRLCNLCNKLYLGWRMKLFDSFYAIFNRDALWIRGLNAQHSAMYIFKYKITLFWLKWYISVYNWLTKCFTIYFILSVLYFSSFAFYFSFFIRRIYIWRFQFKRIICTNERHYALIFSIFNLQYATKD